MAKAKPTDGAVTNDTATEQRVGEGICFVLMPFTVKGVDVSRYPDPDHWRNVYEGLIMPAIGAAGLQPDRDDKDVGSRVIIEEILRKIQSADMVLCDLSSHNPNVFLELGWALRADKPYVLIHDDLTDFTFDLNQTPTHRYGSALQPLQLRDDIPSLTQAIMATKADDERRYSLVTRMEINLQAIAAASGGDAQARMQLEILDRLRRIEERAAPAREPRDDPAWTAHAETDLDAAIIRRMLERRANWSAADVRELLARMKSWEPTIGALANVACVYDQGDGTVTFLPEPPPRRSKLARYGPEFIWSSADTESVRVRDELLGRLSVIPVPGAPDVVVLLESLMYD